MPFFLVSSREYSEGGTQTSEIVIDHKETQSHGSADAQCQTDEVIPDEIVVEDESAELLSFLLYVEEDVTAQLVRNAQSHAFDGKCCLVVRTRILSGTIHSWQEF